MPTRKTDQSMSPARRHFLAASAITAGKVAAGAALATTVLSSSAQAFRPPAVTCFLRGTRILTPQGEVRIEELAIGDLVETVRGEAMPIKWIGRNSFTSSGSGWPESVMPIRIARFALDEQTPHTDLYLSPWHALFIDGVLMPVKDLVNGTSIVPALPPGREAIEYFHLVLDTHEVIVAEGAPAETLLLTGAGREYETFTNFADYERLYPGEVGFTMQSYAPKVTYLTARAHVAALLRLGVSTLVDVRDPLQRAYDRIAARADAPVA
jgi:hypothetical protein